MCKNINWSNQFLYHFPSIPSTMSTNMFKVNAVDQDVRHHKRVHAMTKVTEEQFSDFTMTKVLSHYSARSILHACLRDTSTCNSPLCSVSYDSAIIKTIVQAHVYLGPPNYTIISDNLTISQHLSKNKKDKHEDWGLDSDCISNKGLWTWSEAKIWQP